MGEFKEVHLPLGLSRERQETLRMYEKAKGDVNRTKNRIKTKYREHGVYSRDHRDGYIERVRSTNARFLLVMLYRKLESDEAFRDRLLKRLVSLVGRDESFWRLTGVPGVGRIHSAIFVSVIDDPARFPNKRNLWSYAGLGLRSRWSADPSKARTKGTSGGNRLLKCAALGSAIAAIKGKNRFSSHYRKMVLEGVDPSMARRTVARKILATTLSMLKQDTVYREDFESSNCSVT